MSSLILGFKKSISKEHDEGSISRESLHEEDLGGLLDCKFDKGHYFEMAAHERIRKDYKSKSSFPGWGKHQACWTLSLGGDIWNIALGSRYPILRRMLINWRAFKRRWWRDDERHQFTLYEGPVKELGGVQARRKKFLPHVHRFSEYRKN